MPLKVGILISGRGSNMSALIEACATADFPAEIVTVISNRADAKGLGVAAKAGIATQIIDHKAFNDRASFDAALDEALRAAGVEFVCLAGFMRLLSSGFAEAWHDRLVNIHPSLLPAFKGLDVHEQVLAAGVPISGCTVHFVRPAVDSGPIIAQATVPVPSGATPETLAAAVLRAEHRCYPQALRLVAEGRISVVDEVVQVDGAPVTLPG